MNTLECLRRSRLVPALTLAAFLVPMVPRVARADDPSPPPVNLSAPSSPSTLGATETSPAGVNGLASATVDPSTGVLHTTIPFALPAARGAVQPRLALTYSSSGAFGVGGRGWSLGIPAIERHNPSGPPQFNDPGGGDPVVPTAQDHFTFGGQPLVEICYIGPGGTCAYGGSDPNHSGGVNELPAGEQLPSFVTSSGVVGWHYYRLQTETGALARFFWSENHLRWVVQYGNGETAEYGVPETATDGNVDRDAMGHIFRWNLSSRYDTQRSAPQNPTNAIDYVWTAMRASGKGTALGYLTDIYDTPTPGANPPAAGSFAHHTHLVYTQPAWTPSTSAPVWLAAPSYLLSRVDVTSQDYAAAGARQQVRRYYLTYTSFATFTTDGPPAVASVQLEGSCDGTTTPNNFESGGQLPDPSESSTCPQRPPTTFTYAPTSQTAAGSLSFQPQGTPMPSMTATSSPLLFDLNNDGLPDFIDVGATTPTAWINSATTAGTFVQQPIALPMRPFDLTQMSQLTSGPSYASGAFAMDGHIDMMWNTSQSPEWQNWYATRTPALPICPSDGVSYYCDPSIQYTLLEASFASGTWELVPSAGGTFPLGAEYPLNSNAWTTFAGTFAYGPEKSLGPIDMDGDGIVDLLSSVFWVNYTPQPTNIWNQFSIRYSKRSFDGTYLPFYGTSASAPTTGARTDICVGGLDVSQQNNTASTFADVDGDGIADFVQFGTPSLVWPNHMGSSQPMWWPGHGDGTFGACLDGTVSCPCELATPVPLLPTPFPTTPATSTLTVPTSLPLAVHDVTGDGLADVLAVMPGGFTVSVNRGGTPPTFESAYPIYVGGLLGWSDTTTPSALYFADMDGSGIDDVIVQAVAASGSSVTPLGFIDLQAGGPDGASSLRPGLLTDIDNNLGVTTHVTYQTTPELSRQAIASGAPWLTQSPQPLHVVTGVTVKDSTGDSYATSYTYWNPIFDGHDNQFLGFQKVRQTTPGDAATLMNTDTTYFYGSCGNALTPACVAGVDYPAASYRGLPTLTEVFNGVPTGARQSVSATYLSTTHHSYASTTLYVGSDDRTVRRVYEAQSDSYLYDTSPFQPASGSVSMPDVDLTGYALGVVPIRGVPHHVQKQMTVDGFGNLVSVIDHGDVGDTSLTPPDPIVMQATTWFVPPGTDPSNNWIWRPQTVTAGSSATDPASHSTTYAYDSYGNVTDVTRALVGTTPLQRTPSIAAPNPTGASQDGAAHVAHVTYDATGNPLSVQMFPSSTSNGAASRCAEYAYDPAYSQLVTTETIDVGGCGSAQAIVTTHGYDRVLGVETSTISPGSARSAMTYDGYGRRLSTAKPDPTTPGMTDAPSTTISYTDTAYGQLVHTSQLASPGIPALDTYEYKDAFGRTIEDASTSDTTGQWVVSGQVIRDQRGRVVVAFVPSFVSASSGSTLYPAPVPTVAGRGTTYDAFNRVTQTTDIDDTVTSTMKYHALSVELRDGETATGTGPHAGAYVMTIRDGHGRSVETDQHGNGGVISTVTAYQATGEVTSISRTGSDANGPVSYVRTMSYDTMGRLTINAEPNTSVQGPIDQHIVGGTVAWRYAYDDLGELVGTSDARGCGENLSYDGAGRLLSEDYSPCSTTLQNPWTAPSTTAGDGDGTEAFYVYEGAALQTGRLSDVYDRASHVHLTHDGRGRLTEVDRQIAQPGVPTQALSTRYSPTVFTTKAGYDDRDRLDAQSTGADVPELFGTSSLGLTSFGPSTVTGTYSARGALESVSGTYGAIVAGTVIEADGRPDSVTYADAAKTTIAFSYADSRRRLTEAKISRTAPFPTATATYTPPAAGASQPTQQTVLADDVIPVSGGYDGVNNPLEILDERLASEWPSGAQPVATRSFTYDDSYRVTSVVRTFAASVDAYDPPIAATTSTASPFPLAKPQNRVLNQTFNYDGLGNTIATTDDGNVFFDRSLGTITNGSATGPNQLQSATIPAGSSGEPGKLWAIYDAAGNMVQLGLERQAACTSANGCQQLFQYDWDEVGRLSRARRFDLPGGTLCKGKAGCFPLPTPASYTYPSLPATAANADVSYAYDASGTRVLRASTPAGEATTYSAEIFPSLRLNHAQWDESSLTYERTTDTEAVYLTLGGQAYGRIVYDPNVPSVDGPLHVFLELTDPLSSVSTVIDRDTSELVERTTYLAYGALDSDYRPDRWQNFREDYKFTGKEDDVEIGLTYFGARYYSPQLGRWVSPDPLAIHGATGDLNPYAYVHGRVATDIDPTGLDDDDDGDGPDLLSLTGMSELGVDSPTLAQGSANGSLGVTGNVAFANPGAAPTEGAIETLPDDYITGNRPPPPAPAQSPAASNSDPGGYAVPLPWLEQQIVLHPNRTAAVITAAALAAALGGWVAAGGLGSSAAGGAGGGILVRTAIVAGAAGTGAGPQRTEEAFEEAGTYVYQLVDEGGEAVYYGISNDPARRLAEHALEATKPFNGMQVISQGQPLAQAQALETSLIQQASAEGRLIYNVAPQSISPMLPIQTPSTIVPSVTLLNPALYPR